MRVLSRLFRAKYLAYLRQAYQSDELVLAGQLEHLASARAWHALLAPLYEKDWGVYAKPPFGSPDEVLKYLARYTHRVAISNRRLVSFENDQVAFSYKAYRCGGKRRILQLEAVEFLRRFLLHVLPFVRIRHYGLLANRCQKEKLLRCRERLAQEFATQGRERPRAEDAVACNDLCPVCKEGLLVVVGKIAPSSVGPEARMNSPNDA